MARVRMIPHAGEALVLRTWPFHEADLLVSMLTREQGVVKGVARHAMRSRRRFGGALEPGTLVNARYAERPREDLVRIDSFEILWSPLRGSVSWLRVAGMQLVLEVLEQSLPDQAPEDNVFRLAVTVLQVMEPEPGTRDSSGGDRIWLPLTYFCVWMCRLLGWWPELSACSACGQGLQGGTVWWSPVHDAVSCPEDRRADSQPLSAASVVESARMARTPLSHLEAEAGPWPRERAWDLRAFALALLERHLERRLRSAAALSQRTAQ